MLRKKIIGLLLLATGWTACTQNFDEINTDPNRLEKIDPSTLMTPTLTIYQIRILTGPIVKPKI